MVHRLFKYHEQTELSKLDDDILKLFCDTPVCPSCGREFKNNDLIYLGAWGSEENPIVTYRLCYSCGEMMRNAPYLAIMEVERTIENYIKLLHPNIIERFRENARKKPIVLNRF
ncbi:MAG: hypothetical protein ACXAC2_00690 [Candidatus Kariarchaeaceae archaeon]|jgi:hypothetical protein